MEDKFKRSDRRFRSKNAVKRRIKKLLFYNIHVIENKKFTGEYITTNADREKYVFDGRGFQFLRTTSNPCNCWMCSGEYKYRTHRSKEKREVRNKIKSVLENANND